MKEIKLCETDIIISGKLIKVSIYRNKSGNLEWHPHEDIFIEGGHCENGSCVEGYGQEIIIYKYI